MIPAKQDIETTGQYVEKLGMTWSLVQTGQTFVMQVRGRSRIPHQGGFIYAAKVWPENKVWPFLYAYEIDQIMSKLRSTT